LENAIEIKNVSKTFRLSERKWIFQTLRNINFNSNEKIVAVNDVSFAVKKGEVFGIIGKNGSGKTTLLQIIAGLYNPDSGSVKIDGSLAPIMHIGAGFNPELLPSTNIILYGMMLGLSKNEIKSKINSILQFAELEKFSTMKLKHFSSGMKSRLGISTVFQLNPDIFLLDEILSVGDIDFRQKCFEKFLSYKKQGKTILYVTHALNTLKDLCDRVLLLDMGNLITIGNPEDAIKKYREIFQKTPGS